MSDVLDLACGLVLDTGERWADEAAEFQLADLKAILAPGAPPYSFITRSRGASKTTDMAALALGLTLTAPPRSRLYWCAADQDQGAIALDVIAGFAQRTPFLRGALDVQSHRVLVPSTASSLAVLAADAPGAFGLLPYAVFVDELAVWPDTPSARRLLDALITSAAKLPGCRVVVLTAAGSPRHYAYTLLDHARSDPMWATRETTGPPPWADPARIAEQRRRMPEALYRQLFEGEWVEAEGSFLASDVIDRLFTLDGPALRPDEGLAYVAALDMGHVNDRTVFAIGHHLAGEVHLDLMRTWAGSPRQPVSFSEVEETIVRLHERFGFTLRADPWQALHVLERLRERGVRAEPFTFTAASKQRLASTLLQLANDGALHLYEADGLRDELVALRLKVSTAGTWTFDHASAGHDDRAVALALMAVGAIETRPASGWSQCGACGLRGGHGGDLCPVLYGHADDVVTRRGDLVLRGAHHLDEPGTGDGHGGRW